MPDQGTVELKVSLFKFLIALLLGGNTGLLGFLIRFIWKWYRKYKNAIMLYIEEHEKLIDDYLRRHPEELESYPNYFSKSSHRRLKDRRSTKNPIRVDRPFKTERSEKTERPKEESEIRDNSESEE